MNLHQTELLVVEDDQMNASMIVAVLEERGYRVHAAADGDEGLEMLEKNPEIKGVLTDVFMPNREGIGFLRAVKSRYPRIKIAVMTGAVNYETIFATARDFGADIAIKKPFDIDELADQIVEMLNG